MVRTPEQLNAEILALPDDERSEFLMNLTPDELRELVIYRLCDLGNMLDEMADAPDIREYDEEEARG